MRDRIQRAVLAAVVTALAVLVLPLGFGATALLGTSAAHDIERAALEAAFRVGPGFTTGDPVELPAGTASTVGLYTPAGRLIGGKGPARLEAVALRARAGVIVQTESGGETLAAVPVTANESVIGVVRASRPAGLAAETAEIWSALIAIAALIVAGAALLAYRTARQLAAPVERLAVAARGIGRGRLAVPPDVSGIDEVDAAHAALVGAGKRIADLLGREQRIASDASHQLRTPLAGLRADLELALGDVGADHLAVLTRALALIDRMDATIDGLIALARDPAAATGSCDPIAVAEDRVRYWRSEFRDDPRRLDLGVEGDVPPVAAPRFAVATVLDVLLENACRHGAGDIEVVVRPTGAVVAVDVVNAGPYRGPDDPFVDGASGSGSSGLGLGLARRTAERFGGRLLLAETASRTRFGLLLPARTTSTVSPY